MAIASGADPLRIGLAPAWMVAILFGALSLRIALVALRILRGGSLSRIDAQDISRIPVMHAPPYTAPQIEEALAEIRPPASQPANSTPCP